MNQHTSNGSLLTVPLKIILVVKRAIGIEISLVLLRNVTDTATRYRLATDFANFLMNYLGAKSKLPVASKPPVVWVYFTTFTRVTLQVINVTMTQIVCKYTTSAYQY